MHRFSVAQAREHAIAAAGRKQLTQALAALRPSLNLSLVARRNRDGSTACPGSLGYEAGGAVLAINQLPWRPANKHELDPAEPLVQLQSLRAQPPGPGPARAYIVAPVREGFPFAQGVEVLPVEGPAGVRSAQQHAARGCS